MKAKENVAALGKIDKNVVFAGIRLSLQVP